MAKLQEDKDLQEDGSLGRDSVDNYRHDDADEVDNDREYVTIYESYLKKYRSDLKKCVYLKVLHSRRTLLDVEMVSEKPFRYFTPFPLPHRFHGMSLADVLVDIQKTQSSLKRGVVDHTFMTNTSRFVANLSLVKNPRDLLDNRVGAVIDVNSPNPESVVRPMAMPNLSGTVFQAMESLETEKEARSGMSRMARGMDSTVVSKQNSSDLITQFMNASNRRIMVMCRNFAENFLKPLMFDIYKLAVENEKQQKMIQLDGQFVPINPQFLGDRTEMSVAVALTPEEQAQEAQMLLSLDQQFTANPNDPSLGGMYGAPQRHAMISRAFELLNIKSADMYLFNPNSPEFQQMQQQQQQAQQQKQPSPEMMKAQQDYELKKMKIEADIALEREKMQAELELRREELTLESQLRTAKAITDAEISTNLPRV